MITKKFLYAFTFLMFSIDASPPSWKDFIKEDMWLNRQYNSSQEANLDAFFGIFQEIQQPLETDANDANERINDNFEPPNKLVKHNESSECGFNSDTLVGCSEIYVNSTVFDPLFFNDVCLSNSNQTKRDINFEESLVDKCSTAINILYKEDHRASNLEQDDYQQNIIFPSKNVASNFDINISTDNNHMLKDNLIFPLPTENNLQKNDYENSFIPIPNNYRNGEMLFDIHYTISLPVTDFSNNDSCKALQAFLISWPYSYIAVKNYDIGKFAIGRYDSGFNSLNCETFGGYTNSNNIFTKFKANCKRIATDSKGNLYILQSNVWRDSEIIKLTHDLKLINSVRIINNDVSHNSSRTNILDMRIHADILYLLDVKNKRIIISTLDFEYKGEIKCDFDFKNINGIFLAVSTNYIVVSTPSLVRIYKKDDPKIYVEKSISNCFEGFDFVEFTKENRVIAKLIKSNQCIVIDIYDKKDGDISVSGAYNYISFEREYAKKGFRCCLSPNGESYVACSKDDLKIFEIK